jgi:hypothetical protein
LWWGSTPADFESSFGLAESVERLKAATRRSVFSGLVRQEEEAVGTVTESSVSLQRKIPMVGGNAFKPFYRGRFIDRNGKVFLVGRFTMRWFAKAFMTFWFGGVVCITLLAPALTGATLTALIGLGMIGAVMIGAGTAFVWLCRWFARNDAAWLSNVIRGALCTQDCQAVRNS